MFNPNDYAGITNASEYRDYLDELEDLQLSRKEREALEAAELAAFDAAEALKIGPGSERPAASERIAA